MVSLSTSESGTGESKLRGIGPAIRSRGCHPVAMSASREYFLLGSSRAGRLNPPTEPTYYY